MTKNISQPKLLEFVDTVQRDMLISNNIINRTQQPYYHSHSSVPKSLISYKKRLAAYRMLSSKLLMQEGVLPLNQVPETFKSLAMGTFAHTLIGSLAVSSFGIGDCGECASKLAIALIQAGYSNLAFISINFTKAKTGMEEGHQFIVANLPTMPKPKKNTLSVYDFFEILPENALIGDAFLGLSFKPKQIPQEFIHYVNAFGRETEIVQCIHLYNFTSHSLRLYLSKAVQIEQQLKSKQSLLSEDTYSLKDKIRTSDTTLISLLKEKTKLPFFGVRDEEFKVDAALEVNSMSNQNKAIQLQRALKGHGRFFNVEQGKKVFVLEGINISNENPLLIKNIQSFSL